MDLSWLWAAVRELFVILTRSTVSRTNLELVFISLAGPIVLVLPMVFILMSWSVEVLEDQRRRWRAGKTARWAVWLYTLVFLLVLWPVSILGCLWMLWNRPKAESAPSL